MYVSKPFGGAWGGGGGLHHMHYVFLKKNSPRTTCPQRAHIYQWYTVCKNASRALCGVLLLGAPKHG